MIIALGESHHRRQSQPAVEVAFDPMEQAARNLVADHGDLLGQKVGTCEDHAEGTIPIQLGSPSNHGETKNTIFAPRAAKALKEAL